MDDRPLIVDAGLTPAPVAPVRRGIGLSWKLLILTVAFAMVSAVLIYVPRIANYRMTWLSDRLAMADTAAVVLAAPDRADIPRDIQDELLKAIGATAIAIRSGSVSRLIAAVEMPPEVDATVDLRTMAPTDDVVEAFKTLLMPKERILRVVGNSYNGDELELVIGDRPLREAMLGYSVGVLWLWAGISLILSVLLFFAVNRMFVRPIRRISQNVVAFSEAPDDPGRVIVPSGRRDELGVAEEHLAGMQRELQTTLAEQRHLADLGLAVSKINHDLRNMLASAQLFSDRLGSLPDPTVQRFAPKLIGALDRAIAFTQSTLAYGRAREAPPARRLVRLDRLVEEAADSLGLTGHPTIAFDEPGAGGARGRRRPRPALPHPDQPGTKCGAGARRRGREPGARAATDHRCTARGGEGGDPCRGHRPWRAREGARPPLPGLSGRGASGRHRSRPCHRRRARPRPWRRHRAGREGRSRRALRGDVAGPAAARRPERRVRRDGGEGRRRALAFMAAIH